jgi:hypothetical protein
MSLNTAIGSRALPFDPMPYLQSRLVWVVGLVVLIAARYLYGNAEALFSGAGGTDDMTRLVQVRELTLHGNWFDRTLGSIGAPAALDSHWSRLVDLPLALLSMLFGLFLSSDTADLAVRIVWPSVLLVAMTYLVVREAERQAGLMAVFAVLVLVINSAAATFQFNPGRIDHHNVQILCAIGGILLLTRSFSDPRMGWWAGGFIGLGFAAGLEAFLMLGAIVGVAALISIFFAYMREGLFRTLVAVTMVSWGTLAVTIPPSRWLQPGCDELALNFALLITLGTIAYGVLLRRFSDASPLVWLGGLVAGGGLAVGAYLAVEPACVGGPFAFVDPAVKRMWLDKVIETKSIVAFAEASPSSAVSFFIFVMLGCAALGWAYMEKRDAIALFAFLAMVIAAVYSCIQIKLMPYAMWLAIPAVAVAIARLPAIGDVSARTVKLAAMVLCSQGTMMALVASGVGLLSSADATASDKMAASTKACQQRGHLRALNQLPRGLVLNEVDLGPFIALHSRHRVVSAPYHRIDKSIVATFNYLKGKPGDGEALLRGLGVNYVVICERTPGKLAKIAEGTLVHTLLTGGTVAHLEPVKLGDGASPLKVWRVK